MGRSGGRPDGPWRCEAVRVCGEVVAVVHGWAVVEVTDLFPSSRVVEGRFGDAPECVVSLHSVCREIGVGVSVRRRRGGGCRFLTGGGRCLVGLGDRDCVGQRDRFGGGDPEWAEGGDCPGDGGHELGDRRWESW